jgi:hypothetical protein
MPAEVLRLTEAVVVGEQPDAPVHEQLEHVAFDERVGAGGEPAEAGALVAFEHVGLAEHACLEQPAEAVLARLGHMRVDLVGERTA